MYFNYTSAQNYVRTITQGVTLSDNRKLSGAYKRSLAQTAGANSVLSRFETLARKCVTTAYNSMSINRLPVFFRNVSEQNKWQNHLVISRFPHELDNGPVFIRVQAALYKGEFLNIVVKGEMIKRLKHRPDHAVNFKTGAL
jgi:hypothetical protein